MIEKRSEDRSAGSFDGLCGLRVFLLLIIAVAILFSAAIVFLKPYLAQEKGNRRNLAARRGLYC